MSFFEAWMSNHNLSRLSKLLKYGGEIIVFDIEIGVRSVR
jgi:hypothetical protein